MKSFGHLLLIGVFDHDSHCKLVRVASTIFLAVLLLLSNLIKSDKCFWVCLHSRSKMLYLSLLWIKELGHVTPIPILV